VVCAGALFKSSIENASGSVLNNQYAITRILEIFTSYLSIVSLKSKWD
jgi:hypothetical protein